MSPARSIAFLEDVAVNGALPKMPEEVLIGSFSAQLRNGAFVVQGEADHYAVRITAPGRVEIEDHFGGETHKIAADARDAWVVLEQREEELCRDGKFNQSPGAKVHTSHAAICTEASRFHGDIR